MREAENTRRQLLREDPDVREAENTQRQKLREDPEVRKAENTRRQQHREDPGEREAEATLKRVLREDHLFRDAEAVQRQLRRGDPVVREAENVTRSKRRANSETRRVEKDEWRNRRQDPFVQSQDNEQHRLRREELTVRFAEQEQRVARLQEDGVRMAENEKRKQRKDKSLTQQLEVFRSAKLEGPRIPCVSCHRLRFPSKVKYVQQAKLRELKIIDKDEGLANAALCATCWNYVRMKKIPSIWTGNGFGLNDVPESVRSLNRVEAMLVALRIAFMVIFAAFNATGQKKMRGNVVNVPVDVDTSTSFLPRSLDRSHIMAVDFKRRLGYKSNYLSMNVRPYKVWQALKDLQSTSLYRGVEVNKDWLTKTLQDVEGPVSIHDGIENDDNEDEANVGNMDTMVMKNDMIAQIAPGEGRHPLFILMDKHAEEKAFPTLFGGEPRKHKNPMKVYPQIIRTELMNKDRRFARDTTNLFYKLRVHVIRLINSAVNFIMVRKKKDKNITAGEAAADNFASDHVKRDEAFRSCLVSVVNSPAYFDQEKYKVMAMIRQLGKPSIFLTLSPCEKDWKELHVVLREAQLNRKLNPADIDHLNSMSSRDKADLISGDPVICATYFMHRFHAMFKVITSKKGFFADHPVTNYYYRIEYQQRGSPHAHMLLWLDNVPVFQPNDPTTFSQVESLIDKYISCSSDHPFAHYHRHRHTFTCYKTSSDKNRQCRFNIPYPPMRRTQILTPFAVGENTDKKTAAKRKVAFEDLQKLLNNDHDDDLMKILNDDDRHKEHINVLRSSITRPTVFLKRDPKDKWTSCYNSEILSEWQANTDMQWILDPYGLVHYLVNYINKAQKGMSKIMKQVREKMLQEGEEDLRKQMKAIGSAFVNIHEVSSQESAITSLGIHQCQASAKCEYVNTSPSEQRTRVLKTNDQLQKIASKNPDSTDIFVDGLLQHYAKRPESRVQMCLADFATWFNIKRKSGALPDQDANENSDNQSDEGRDAESDDDSFMCGPHHVAKKRKQQKILRYRRYNAGKDPLNFMRENIMLFLPWVNEENDITNIDITETFILNREVIEQKSKGYNRVSHDDLVEALNVLTSIAEDENVEISPDGGREWFRDTDKDWRGEDPGTDGQDLVFGTGEEQGQRQKFSFVKNPAMLSDDDFHLLISPLNEQQKKVFHHYVHNLRQQMLFKEHPKMHIFITGAAGVGKSLLIRALTQATVRIVNKSVTIGDVNAAKILLTAPMGKAAFNIGGTTLHSTFNLPVHKLEIVPPLSSETVNTLSVKMADLKTLVIDEVSMCSRDNFGLVDKRLRQILAREDEWFGGVNVLIFGDFYQLPPVGALPIYSTAVTKSNADSYDFLNGPTRWGLFKFFELTMIMRQRDDLVFAQQLTRYGRGLSTEEDCKFFETLRKPQSQVTFVDDALHLFYDNKGVNHFNEVALKEIKGREIMCPAIDVGDSRAVKRAPNLDIRSKHGLHDVLHLKENAQYMVVVNVDTEDGLVNGAVGVLKSWDMETHEKSGEQRVSRVWLQFDDKRIGSIARSSCASKQAVNLTPLERRNEEICTKLGNIVKFVRKQIPLTPAMAISIHKSQGGTYDRVSVHLSKYASRKCSAVYVALSRVTSSNGLTLYTEDDIKFPFPTAKPSPAITAEMARLNDHEQLSCVYDQMPKKPLIMAFNIRSFKKHFNDVANDRIMTSAVFLFFFETGLASSDAAFLHDYTETRIPVRKNPKRGTSMFVHKDKATDVTDVQTQFQDDTVSYEYVSVKYRDSCLIFAVYLAPRTSETEILKLLKKFKKQAATDKCTLIVCGDFNCDFETVSKTTKKWLSKHDLRPLITAATHDNNSCIDNIITDSRHLRSIVYESVCSDHRPIFANWVKDDVTSFYPYATASLRCSTTASMTVNAMSASVPASANEDEVRRNRSHDQNRSPGLVRLRTCSRDDACSTVAG